ncbi:Uncharacterised protein [Mycobacterium tuberculosis]|nr:Uncharacterised protein [Mycobacterium tuberculosis]COY14485.1 Uncharacterised protein [Mycobacterium tuberculosis]COY42672.1 Uncharacterised protein [Mycobacterium tuberculosis]
MCLPERIIRILDQAYGMPSPIRVSGTTVSRAVSSDRKSTPCRPALSMEYNRTLVSGKVPTYGIGSAVPSLVLLMRNGTRPT